MSLRKIPILLEVLMKITVKMKMMKKEDMDSRLDARPSENQMLDISSHSNTLIIRV